jgi:hypothetical protein
MVDLWRGLWCFCRPLLGAFQRHSIAPAWQDIAMDRTAWNKMLRSIYTN